MRLLYNILFLVFFCLTAPFYFLKMLRRGNWRHGFGQRFGRYNSKVKQAMTNRHVVWIHAVSVGEVNIATQLIQAMERRLPNLKIVVSTTTSTGMGELNRVLPSHIQKIYYPIDRRMYVRRAIAAIHPEAVILVEAEIWPNFLWAAADRDIPVFLVNARLSERSFPRYRFFSVLFRPLFRSLEGVGCQNEQDAERLRKLGCRPETIRVVGSLKYDAAKLDERRPIDVPQIFNQLGAPERCRVLLGGSTHPGEEALLSEVYARLRVKFPDLFLVIVPRHAERGKEVGQDVAAKGLRFAYRKDITPQTRYKPGEIDCLVVNTTGELKHFYEHAAVVFVGKSLSPSATGGQNPIEPAVLGKPIVFGPNMGNFDAIVREFLKQNGAIQVKSGEELEQAFTFLLENPDQATALGRHAVAVVRQNLGAIERTVEMLVEHLEGTDIYVAPWRDESNPPQKG